MAFKKYAKKMVRKGLKYARKRYVKKTAGKSVYAVARDVARLKRVLNPEQKRYQLTITERVVSQCSANTSGHWVQNITPTPAQGITGSTRNGNSIKLSSLRFRFQLRGQSAQLAPIRLKYYLFGAKGQSFQSTAQANSNLIDPNVFTTLYDFHSDRNQEALGTIKMIKTGIMYLKGAAVTNGSVAIANAVSISDYVFSVPLKNFHVKYDSDTTNVVSGALYLAVYADSGNGSTTTASTLANIPVLAANTGLILNMDMTTHFYDN